MYREVTMIELKELLRLWCEGLPKKRLAAQVGLDPKTACRYLAAAAATGLRAGAGAVSDEYLCDVLLAQHPAGGRPRRRLDPLCPTAQMFAAAKSWLRCVPATTCPLTAITPLERLAPVDHL